MSRQFCSWRWRRGTNAVATIAVDLRCGDNVVLCSYEARIGPTAATSIMEETKVIYHIDDEDTPYLVKLPIAADKVTLADFKNVLNRPNYKFFFKSMDDDFGLVIRKIHFFFS